MISTGKLFNMKNILKRLLIPILLLSTCFCTDKAIETPLTPETALQAYLDNNDEFFAWELKDSYDRGNLKIYDLLVTSQKWREYIWRHQLTVIVPDDNNYDGALLFITGGSNSNEMPNWKKHNDDAIKLMSEVALKNKAVVAVLYQVPNQPLYNGLTEDALISFTLHNYREDKDLTWPLLFPMVKSAVRSLDAIQAFATGVLEHEINRFVISGGSKRGWTTWLTGAGDPRVEAIAPMVIDMLNMPESINYHITAWGDYSVQIQDYVNLGIAQDVNTRDGQELTAMIDPFSYREKLTMPKLIILGTNDEYWPADVIKHYLYELYGENYIHYVPNAGHGLGDKIQATKALSAFFGETLKRNDYPACSWHISEDEGHIILNLGADREKLIGALLWTADSDVRDFRESKFLNNSISVASHDLQISIEYPESGFRAFYVDLIYPDPNGGTYSKSTRMFISNEDQIL